MSTGNQNKLLLSRVLTKSGDQAWDFALPLGFIHLFPERIDIAAIYFLAVKTGQALCSPILGKWIDLAARKRVIKFGIFAQFFAVIVGLIVFLLVDHFSHQENMINSPTFIILFSVLCGSGVLASLGSHLTEISIGSDLAPQLIPAEQLTQFNSKLRRIDLLTETLSPVIAGLLLATSFGFFHYFGFVLVAIWNIISFFPEYFLLRKVLRDNSEKIMKLEVTTGFSLPSAKDFQLFIRHPVFLPVLAYSMLWLTVLSPHGVLLTGFLKDQWKLSEFTIGLFRGGGAIFGLISTLSFPYFVKKMGVPKAGLLHLGWQIAMLSASLYFFFQESIEAQYAFLGLILLSRIGLYGFGNAELELRQKMIAENERGLINSMGALLTTIATIFIFLAGIYFKTFAMFYSLVIMSVIFVGAGFLIFLKWYLKPDNHQHFPDIHNQHSHN